MEPARTTQLRRCSPPSRRGRRADPTRFTRLQLVSWVPARIVTVVGNPKPLSRTYRVADRLVNELTGRDPNERIDLAELGSELLDWSSKHVAEKVDLLASADFAVIATPTYKASFTGLLKLF